ncbi:MAG: lipopolysaccharide kinase InaA family protein, partial [Gammaproteobacteria bacterium]
SDLLDGGGIRASGLTTSLALRPALENLALFFAQFPLEVDALIDSVLPAYLRRREWDSRELSSQQLQRRVKLRRRWRQRRFLDKVFSNCSAFACDRKWWHNRVYDRTLESPELIKVLIEPDVSLQYPGTRILQQGGDSTLWLSRIGERRIVIKRYNINGIWQGILRAVRESGAAVSWRNAHRLVQYGIATARPVAMVEERFGPLRGRAWYLSEYVAGETAAVLCEAEEAGEGGEAGESSGKAAFIRAVASLLQQLERCRICHGDMDASSFILAEHGPVVIDLDTMQEHSSRFVFRHRWRRELGRFMRNWDACPDVAGMFRELLKPG